MADSGKNEKPKRAKSRSAGNHGTGPVITDPRFANIQSDPRYRLPSKRHTHVKLDKRFAHMLRDEDFSKNAAVDRYGRKLRRDDTKKQLERFYRLDEDGEDEGKEEQEEDAEKEEENENDDNMSVDDDAVVEKELRKADKRGYDPARDGGFSESSSDESSSEEEDEYVEEDVEEIQFPNQQQSDVPLGDVSRRIAVVNLDWDNIRAQDLMAVFSSFLPPGGSIHKVSIYPSEFGRERMEREEMEGPPKEIFASKKKKDEESDLEDSDLESEEEDEEEEEEKIKQSIIKEDQGDEFDSAHLRKYQLERLRYFYAILICSSEAVAKHIYDAVDGTEYMSSANFFDLRFVPDETDFSNDTPRDECDRIPDGYKPSDFVTDALQHSKVKLTWDADDTSRKEAQARAFKGGRKEIDENDLKAYLGSDSSDDGGDENGGVEVVDATAGDGAIVTTAPVKLSKKEAAREKMRALLGFNKDKSTTESRSKGPVGDMEITFSAGLSTGASGGNVFENEPEKEETTAEKYIRKERERKARRKARMKAARNGEPLLVDGEAEDKAPEDSKGEKEDLGFDDPFFTAPEQDAAAATARRREERRKKREEREADEAATAAKRAELELLMVDDKTSHVKHFDMKDIEKAEKRARKAGKKKGKKSDTVEPPPDNFKVDVKDERFQRLWENHEFAIDPSNPRFKATEGMKALLEEGRKRRRNKDDDIVADRGLPEPGKKRRKGTDSRNVESVADADDLNKLVERVKGKTRGIKS
ncbi:pre-rRNA processing protein Esf1 [Blastomyces dermatitidis ER-3]|uniref:Pre-rRNA processing protein Esf1 n=1 Tax=Ajellomyces dermatitidis (strain ER-3 / ATCC MYA-2586) TaxID=559297 RepID=A0ABP2EJK5_AJEDR|nr:pre-rRNA processing protein Esf1 [Blastomyces dermatitidis ER-3]EEQ83245.1 pre-rRNA processing protein Esf1 [Blastomyces dermatitidis ER-3]